MATVLNVPQAAFYESPVTVPVLPAKAALMKSLARSGVKVADALIPATALP